MIGREDKQLSFIDKEVFDRLPNNNILVRIKEAIDFDKIAKQLEVYYEPYQGRPSWPIVLMVKLLFLEIYFKLSDREVTSQLRYNFLFRWFLDLSFPQGEPEYSTLSRFRSRIGEEGAKKIFRGIVRQAAKAGVLDERIKSIDATHIQANAKRQGVIGFLNSARKKIISFFRKDKEEETEDMKEEFVDKGPYGKSSPERIEKEIRKTEDFIQKVGSWCNWKGREWLDLLRETIQKIENGIKDRVYSLTDPDARWGHKSKDFSFFGYKFHAVQDESGIVTSLETIQGNVNESPRAVSLLKEEKERGIEGDGVSLDALYDSGDNRKAIRKLGLEPYILSNTKERKLDEFWYDPEKDLITCKNGKHPIGRIRQENGNLHYFSTRHCERCPYLKECVGDKKRQRVWVSDAERETQNREESNQRSSEEYKVSD